MRLTSAWNFLSRQGVQGHFGRIADLDLEGLDFKSLGPHEHGVHHPHLKGGRQGGQFGVNPELRD